MKTSLYSVLCIVIRLGVVFLGFGAVTKAVNVFATSDRYDAATLAMVVGVLAAILLFALLLWVYPGVLARIAAGRSSQHVFESPITAAELQWIALSILGMYFVLSAIIALANYGAYWLMLRSANATFDEDHSDLISNVVYLVVQLAIGIVVVLGAKGLTGLLRRLRYGNPTAGTEAASE